MFDADLFSLHTKYYCMSPVYTSFVVAMILLIAILLTAASCTAKKTAHNLCHHRQAFIPPIKIRRDNIEHNISLLLAKKSYDNDKKKVSQQEILLDLDRKFDYEGRIKSKIVDVSDDNDDDVVVTSDEEEASLPHRCALLTILG